MQSNDPLHALQSVFDSLDRLRKEIEEERVYWQEGMDAEVLSTTRDAKEAEEKLAVKLVCYVLLSKYWRGTDCHSVEHCFHDFGAMFSEASITSRQNQLVP